MLTHRFALARRRLLLIAPVLALVTISHSVPAPAGATAQASKSPRPTIVLVHGDWADGSSWTSVIERLQRKDFTVVAPPNLLRGPATDAPYLASYLKSIPGPIVLVAHSYGGFVATNAATGNETSRPSSTSTRSCPTKARPPANSRHADTPAWARTASISCRTTAAWICTCAGRRTGPTRVPRVLRQRRRSGGRCRSGRHAAARGSRAVHRAVRVAGVEDDPVLVPRRDVGQGDPACAAGGDGQSGRRPHHSGRGRPPDAHHTSWRRHEAHPVGGRRDELIRLVEAATTVSCSVVAAGPDGGYSGCISQRVLLRRTKAALRHA